MSRRGENIHQRCDGRWEARISITNKYGIIVSKSIYGKSYRDAKNKKNEFIKAIDEQDKVLSLKTLQEIADEWLQTESCRLKKSTYLKYQGIIYRHINPVLGKYCINTVDEKIINKFLLSKLEAGRIDNGGELSQSYVKTIGIVLSSIINYAILHSYREPLKGKIILPRIDKQKIEILTNKEYSQLEQILLLDNSTTALGAILSLYTGMRIGEICALRWEDINLTQNTIYIKHTISRILSLNDAQKKTELVMDNPKTKASIREIPITSELKKILMKAQKNKLGSYVISENDSFVSPRTFEYRFHRLLTKNNVRNINFHILRHTFATRCVESNVDIKTLSEILGHSSVSITLNTYVHPSFESKLSQLEKLHDK